MTSSLKFRRANWPSSSPSSAHQWTYDVFLSFRGQDTRKNFTSHLYDALERVGLKTFIDDEQLRSGEEIPSKPLKAIEESRISIVVLSENYASSAWCLEELTKISECREEKGQRVVPVYYRVDPSDVRYQRGTIGESFGKLEERFKDNPEKVQRWREVVVKVCNLSGWHISDSSRDEALFIREIIQFIANYTNLQVAKHPVEIESPVQEPYSSPSLVGIESPVQEPHLSSSLSPVRTESLGIESPGQEPDSSQSRVGIESSVQEAQLSSSPLGNGEQGSNSFLSSHGVFLFLIGSMIGLLQLHDLFKTHPANMWISEAALIIFCLSYAAMANINGTRWEKHSQIIGIFRILSGTLVAVSLSSIHLPHQLSWLFYVIWALMVLIVVAFTWIYPEA